MKNSGPLQIKERTGEKERKKGIKEKERKSGRRSGRDEREKGKRAEWTVDEMDDEELFTSPYTCRACMCAI